MRARESGYNGWANRETWVVNLWLTNDEGTYLGARSIAADALEEGREYARQQGWPIEPATGLGRVEQRLEEHVADLIEEEYDEATMLTDLINSALSHVNWREIAEGMVAE